MSDWNLDDRVLKDTKRGVIPQKECTRGRSKRHPRPFLVMSQPKDPSKVFYRWRGPRIEHRCLSRQHAEQMLAKCLREGQGQRNILWIEVKA